MKILLLTHKFYPDIGGIETISELLSQAFMKVGHKVHLITWSKDDTCKSFPYKVIRNPTLRQLIKEHAWADMVFENNPSLRLSWPNLIFHRPLYVALQTWISRTDGRIAIQDKIKLKWLNRARSVIACSKAIRNSCWPNAVVIGNSYNDSIFKEIPAVVRTNDFVFLGRLVSDKGADIAIKAFKKLLLENNFNMLENVPPTLTIIGEGPERQALQKMVSDAGLNNKIIFTGPLRKAALVERLNQHKFLLVPSVWEEPFGIVALEGMACGCIPIVSNGGGLPDAVGKAGIVFERGNVDSLFNCMNNILDDFIFQKELRKAASDHLQAHHSNVVASEYLSVIKNSFFKKV